MLACLLSCRMCIRNISLIEKVWKVRREVFMLLFIKLFLKDWLVIFRNYDVDYFYFIREFGIINGIFFKLYFVFW